MEKRSDSESYIEYLRRHYEKFKTGSAPYIFEGDEEAFESEAWKELEKDKKTKLHTELMPQPVTGDIMNAKIVFCFFNPGFAENDINEEARLRVQYLRQLKQEDAYFYGLRKEYEDYGIGKYWRTDREIVNKNGKITKKPGLFKINSKEYSIVSLVHEGYHGKYSIEDVYNMLSKIVADIELVPYHSDIGPDDTFNKLLDSSKRAIRFLHDELLPNAREKGQLICITRHKEMWGITEKDANGKNGKYEDVININSNKTGNTQSPTTNIKTIGLVDDGNGKVIHKELKFGKRIYDHLEKLSDGFTKPLAELD